jgi:hypothetical protein
MTLRHRVAGVGGNSSQWMAGAAPAVDQLPATPHESPAFRLNYTPNQVYPWGTATYEDLPFIWAADGALIPAVSPGPFGKTVPAGVNSPAHR